MSRTPSDRRIREPADLENLRFDERGLVPVVAQDTGSGAVLMLARANREALESSLTSGFMHFWSRSRGTLWKKGETSGNTLAVGSLHADCDRDAVLARVHPSGPACHTGEPTCFGKLPDREGRESAGQILTDLWRTLEARDRERPEGSYTTRLLADENLRLKKLGEELVEFVAALTREDGSASAEAADLVYHLMVALKGAGRSWTEVEEVLAGRKR